MHISHHRWYSLIVSLILGMLVSFPLFAAKTEAGTVINNQAKLSYFDTEDGRVKHIFSNIAEITVKEQHALEFDGSGGVKKVSAGQQISFSQRLTNTGNLESDFQVKVKSQEGDQGFDNYKLIIDSNGDGQYSTGEPKVPVVPCDPVDTDAVCFDLTGIDQGEVVEFVVVSTIDAGSSANEFFEYDVEVKSVDDDTVKSSVTNKAVVIEGANLILRKTATPRCGTPVKPNETVSFLLAYSNVGSDKPEGSTFLIDGEEKTGIILEDEILPNFTLQKSAKPEYAPFDGVVLVKLGADRDTNKWVSFDSWNEDDVAYKVGLFIRPEQVDINQSGYLKFELEAPSSLTEGVLHNVAGFNLGGSDNLEFPSNDVCVSLSKSDVFGQKDYKAKIRFLKPIVSLQASDTLPKFWQDNDFEDTYYYRIDYGLSGRASDQYFLDRDGVFIELQSNSRNQKGDIIEEVIVDLVSTEDDNLRVKLKETGPNTGLFRSLRTIRVSNTSRGGNGLCAASDNSANYENEDTICKIKGQYNGLLTVSSLDPGLGEIISDTALLDPSGMVFDAATREAISGAKISIKVPNATATADDDEMAVDPLTGNAYEPMETGSDGRYVLPLLAAGNYYLSVEAPSAYDNISKFPISMFIGLNVSDYSYGKDGFNNTTNAGVFSSADIKPVDIPLDPKDKIVFEMDKTTSSTQISVGEMITYSVKIKNHLTANNLYAVVVNDHIPYGFRYVNGTSFLNGKRIDDPIGIPGPYLRYEKLPFHEDAAPGQLNKSSSHTLTYTLRVTAGAIQSDGVNSISATGRTETSFVLDSNTSKATVKVTQEGVLGSGGIIFGKIFVDANCDNRQNSAEWPIGGVKLYMEDGTWVITDGNGQFSLYGIEPGDHVLKIDPITLPEGIRLKPLDNRHMADPGSRLIDLKNGEFHRADFAAMCPGDDEMQAIFDQIKSRNTGRTDWMLENAEKYDPSKTAKATENKTADGDTSSGSFVNKKVTKKKQSVSAAPMITRGFSLFLDQFDTVEKATAYLKALPASLQAKAFVYPMGDFHSVRVDFSLKKAPIDTLKTTYKNFNKKARVVTTIYERLTLDNLNKLEESNDVGMMARPQDLVKTITKKQGKKGEFIWPTTDVSLDGRFMAVIRAGIEPTLMVNGKAIPASQIGERIANKREKAQVVAWYGVNLEPGENKLEVTGKDPFGNNRVLAKGVFKRPSKPVLIKLKTTTNRLPADGGRTYIPVTIKILDENGYPARGVNFVTLEASQGSWIERDIQDLTPGKQVRIINGERTVHFRSSEKTGEVKLKIADGDLVAETSIIQIAPLRPLMAAGLVSIGAQSNRFSNIMNAPGDTDDVNIDGRTAFFVKGRVVGDMHLTLSYDSEKEEGGQRFRDVNPNAHYPLYGDDSQRGYEAQSRSPLYGKLEKDLNSAMWGDYITDSKGIKGDVARVSRSLTGANVILDNGKTRVQAYVARPEENNVTEEFPGKGIALNYTINNAPIVRNSEIIEKITYSRENPGIVLETVKLSRFVDYHLDDIVGELSFTDSIPSFDDDNNPVFIRISYDLEDGGTRYTVAGARAIHKINNNIQLGASYSYDDHETDGKTIVGITGEFKQGDTQVNASIAQLTPNDASLTKGKAVRIEAVQKWNKNSSTNVTVARADKGYTNTAGGVSAGREEVKIAHNQKVAKGVTVKVEGTHSKSLETKDTQQTLGATADVKVKGWTLKGGARHIRQETDGETDNFNTVIAGAKRSFKIGGRSGSVSGEYEQDIGNADRSRISVGADMQIHDNVKVYGKAERINSLSGIGGLSTDAKTDTFALGVKSKIGKSTEVYSEYRLRGSLSGQDAESASGIKGTYQLGKGVTASPRIEVVRSHSGDGGDSVAASVGVQDNSHKNMRNSVRFEARHDDSRDYIGFEGSHTSRINEEWSLMAKEALRIEFPKEAEEKYDNSFSVGLARRQRTEDSHNMLFMYQNLFKKGYDNQDCITHILSTHQSVEVYNDILLSGRVGGKYKECDQEGGDTITSDAVIVDGRIIWDLNNRWDIDVHGGALSTDGFNENQYSAGAGINYLVRENLRVGAGYNVIGFDEDELDSEGYNKEGVYIGLQYKFDEKSLPWLSGSRAANDDFGSSEGRTSVFGRIKNNIKNWVTGE